MSGREIETAVQQLAGTFKKDFVQLILATVKSVDEKAATCQCVISGTDIVVPDIKLQAEVCDGMLLLPVVNSTVTILTSTYHEPLIVHYSDIDKFYLQAGDSSITVTNDKKIQLNDGQLGGLIKIEELVKQLNTLQDDINTLKNVFSSWVVAPSDGGQALKTAAGPWSALQITKTQKSDIENDKITHGN